MSVWEISSKIHPWKSHLVSFCGFSAPGSKNIFIFREHQDQDHVTFNDANDMVSYWIKGSEGPCVLLRTETWMEIQYAMIFKQGEHRLATRINPIC